MKIGNRIKEIARSKGISAQELGKNVGRTKQAMYDIYSQKVSVSTVLLEKIAKALNEPLHSFYVTSEKDYMDMVPEAIAIRGIHTLMDLIHEKAQEGNGLVNLTFTRSPEGRIYFDYEFRPLESKLTEDEIKRFENRVFQGMEITRSRFQKDEDRE